MNVNDYVHTGRFNKDLPAGSAARRTGDAGGLIFEHRATGGAPDHGPIVPRGTQRGRYLGSADNSGIVLNQSIYGKTLLKTYNAKLGRIVRERGGGVVREFQ